VCDPQRGGSAGGSQRAATQTSRIFPTPHLKGYGLAYTVFLSKNSRISPSRYRTNIANGVPMAITERHCMSQKLQKVIYLDPDLDRFIKERCAAIAVKTGEPISQSEWIRRLIRQAKSKFKAPTLTDVLGDEPEEEVSE
jgi:hypothetical protein